MIANMRYATPENRDATVKICTNYGRMSMEFTSVVIIIQNNFHGIYILNFGFAGI